MSAPSDSLQNGFDRAFAVLSRGRETFMPQLTAQEVGTITSVATGIARVSGLPGVGFDELVMFPGDVFGIAFNVDPKEIGVVLLGEYWHLNTGDEVRRKGRVMDVAVGNGLPGSRHRPARPTPRRQRTGGRKPAPAYRTPGRAHHGSGARHSAAPDRN